MGWGILGGAAVKEYQNASQIAREREWEDMQRAEWQRQTTQRVAMDAAANGTPGAQPTPNAPDPSTQQPVQQDPSQAAPAQGAGLQLPTPGVDSSLAGYQDPTDPTSAVTGAAAPAAPAQAPSQPPAAPPPPTRAYSTGGQTYATAGPQHAPTQSEIMMHRAEAMMNSGGGVAAMQTAMQMRTQALEMASQERDMQLRGILTSNAPAAVKAQQLAGMVDSSWTTPGSASIEQRNDGLYLVHSMPGRDQPFAKKLQGSSPDEVLNNLAMQVRGMTDPNIYLKMQEAGMKGRELDITAQHYKRSDDNHEEMTAVHAQHYADQARWMAEKTAMQGDSNYWRNAALLDRANRQNWQPFGQDKDGNQYERDVTTGRVRKVDVPAGMKLYPKISGERPDALATEAGKAALMELQGMKDPTPADKFKLVKKYGLPADTFGPMQGLPDPSALPPVGKPQAAAPAQGRGLQVSPPAPQASNQPAPPRMSSDPVLRQMYLAAQDAVRRGDTNTIMQIGQGINSRKMQLRASQGNNIIDDTTQ